MSAKTPLAWKNLTHDRRRLAVAVSGVGFAVLLIFMQLGFLNALLESTVQVLRRLNGELVIISATKYALPARERFELRRVQQAAGVAGVASASPIYLETLGAVLRPEGLRGYPIRVLAFHPADQTLLVSPTDPEALSLQLPETAWADAASRDKYGFPDATAPLAEYRGELNGQRIRLGGLFHMGVDFANDGNLLMSADNFARYFPQRDGGGDPLGLVDLAVVKLQPGADPLQVRAALDAALPDDVEIVTKETLITREMTFWRKNAPVGYIFLVGVYVGFLVGVIICYQIIYSDITDHMSEFATLKAMGYSHRYFFQLVLWQALYLSLFGFVPGLIVSQLCYQSLASFTGLTMQLTMEVVLIVLAVTITMCMVSGVLAVRKLLAADPAELF